MASKNYVKGRSFEYSFLNQLEKKGEAVKSGRFFASRGVTDVWWVDKQGRHNEAQLKYSKKRSPYISPHELVELKKFAEKFSPYFRTWLVKREAYKPIEMELMT